MYVYVIIELSKDLLVLLIIQIVVHKNSPRGIHFRRAGPRQKVLLFYISLYLNAKEVIFSIMFMFSNICLLCCIGLF
jgi:hypothetical protein